jgi:hypothetical protein
MTWPYLHQKRHVYIYIHIYIKPIISIYIWYICIYGLGKHENHMPVVSVQLQHFGDIFGNSFSQRIFSSTVVLNPALSHATHVLRNLLGGRSIQITNSSIWYYYPIIILLSQIIPWLSHYFMAKSPCFMRYTGVHLFPLPWSRMSKISPGKSMADKPILD